MAVPLDDETRAMTTREMVAAAGVAGLTATAAASVADALARIPASGTPPRVLVTGSHLLVGETLRANM